MGSAAATKYQPSRGQSWDMSPYPPFHTARATGSIPVPPPKNQRLRRGRPGKYDKSMAMLPHLTCIGWAGGSEVTAFPVWSKPR
jgi:hypothetical protein